MMAEHPTGIPILLEPLVTRVLASTPSPYTYTGTQSYVVGDRDVAIIDPGPDDPAHLDALTRAIAGRPVVAIVITHHHRDHSPASRPLARLTGAPIVGAAPPPPIMKAADPMRRSTETMPPTGCWRRAMGWAATGGR